MYKRQVQSSSCSSRPACAWTALPNPYRLRWTGKGREVTEDNIEETITYVPLGKIIPIDANGRLIPNVPTPTFNNDANNPTKVSETLVPHIPGYRPMQQSVMPESLTDDILVEYAPILEDVTQPTLQTVFFKGAGEATPSVNIQSDFTFTGKYNLSLIHIFSFNLRLKSVIGM